MSAGTILARAAAARSSRSAACNERLSKPSSPRCRGPPRRNTGNSGERRYLIAPQSLTTVFPMNCSGIDFIGFLLRYRCVLRCARKCSRALRRSKEPAQADRLQLATVDIISDRPLAERGGKAGFGYGVETSSSWALLPSAGPAQCSPPRAVSSGRVEKTGDIHVCGANRCADLVRSAAAFPEPSSTLQRLDAQPRDLCGEVFVAKRG